jgi:hypothetical protein
MAILSKCPLRRDDLDRGDWCSLFRTGVLASFVVDNCTKVHVRDSATQRET